MRSVLERGAHASPWPGHDTFRPDRYTSELALRYLGAKKRTFVSVGTAFTGYLSQQNFDSEWISTQAKDGINATGAGAFWNVLNFGHNYEAFFLTPGSSKRGMWTSAS